MAWLIRWTPEPETDRDSARSACYRAGRQACLTDIVPADALAAKALAETVAGMSLPLAMMAREAVGRAFETTLTESVLI